MAAITNRWYLGYQQKRLYQRSFLAACLVAYGFCAGAVLLLLASQDTTVGGGETRVSVFPSVATRIVGSTAGSDSDGLHRLKTGRGGLRSDYRSGYVGAVRIVRQAEANRPVIAPVVAEHEAHEGPVLQPIEVDIPAAGGTGYGAGRGEYWGDGQDPFGLAPSQPYLPPVGHMVGRELTRLEMGESRDARIVFEPPVWPFLADNFLKQGDTGIVYVWLLIRPDATIRYEILSEIPTGYGFGHSVESSLLRSRYEPPVCNGQRDSVSFVLRVLLCRECESYVAEQPPGVKASVRQAPRLPTGVKCR